MEVLGQNRGRGGAILTPNKFVLPFGGSYICANFGENRSRNATVRVPTDGHIHTLTDANQFYNLSHAICYSYGTNNYQAWCIRILQDESLTIMANIPCIKNTVSCG